MIELRPHQVEAVNALRHSLRCGHLRPILAAPCSMGKTMIAAFIMLSAAQKGKRSMFFCDRLKLLHQTTETFKKLNADFSVLQADDPRYDPSKLIQIASIQTATKRNIDFDLAIVDECHTQYKGLIDIMQRWTNIPFIGLSATPYSVGLGAKGKYDDLVCTITPRQLIQQGWLAPTDYYVGRSVSTDGVKTRALSTGGSDYDPEELGNKMLKDDTLAGDIVENYRKHSNNLTRRAIAFSPNIAYSKSLVERFNKAGIPSHHIDGYTPDEERQVLYEDFKKGRFMVLSCSRLLGVGFDDPGVELLIDCYKTRSQSAFIQRAGRIWRIAEGKERACYLDHAGNLMEHGFPEDIVPESLDDGEKKFAERNQVKKEDVELEVHECPQCSAAFTGRKCECGYELPRSAQILKDDGTELKKVNRLATKQEKQAFLSGLIKHGLDRGYKEGWSAYAYKQKYGVWPRGLDKVASSEIPVEVRGYIQHLNIKNAKRREAQR
jgi:DNA repair protein RadD